MGTTVNTFALKLDNRDFKTQLDEVAKQSKVYNDQISASILKQAQLGQELSSQTTKLASLRQTGSKEEIANQRLQIQTTKDLIAAEKQRVASLQKAISYQSSALKSLQSNTEAKDKNTESTKNLANQTIRYLRWAGTIAGVVYAANRAWDATLGKGIEVNRMMEDNTSGIGALLSANTQMILSNGEVVSSYEKFRIGQQVATKTMDELRKASIKTYATFPQLTEIFQQAIGQTLSMGDSFGTTVDEINANTIKLSQRMSNIAGAIGQPMDRVREEIRSLLSANASTDSLIATMIFGSPSEANKAVRDAKARGTNGLSDMLDAIFKPFDALENVDSYTRSLLTLEDAWSQTMAKVSEPIFKDLKDVFKDLASSINENKDSISELGNNFYTAGKQVGKFVSDVVGFLYAPFKLLQDMNRAIAFMSGQKVEGLDTSQAMMAMDKAYANLQAEEKKLAEIREGSFFRNEAMQKQAVSSQEAIVRQAQANFDRYVRKYNSFTNEQIQSEKAVQAEQQEAVETIQKYADLQTKIPINAKLYEKISKDNNKAQGEIIKIQTEINEANEEAVQYGKAYNSLQDKSSSSEKIKLAMQSRALEIQKFIANKEKEIIELREAADKKASDARKKAFDDIRKEQNAKYNATVAYDEDVEKRYKEVEDYQNEGFDNWKKEQKNRQRELMRSLFLEQDLEKQRIELTLLGLDKERELARLQHERNIEEIENRRMQGDEAEEYYDKLIEYENERARIEQFNYTMTGQIIQTTSRQMKDSLGDFLDFASDGFLDFGNLAMDVLNQILKKQMEMQIISPLVDFGTEALINYFNPTAALPSLTSMGVSTIPNTVTMNARGNTYNSPSLSAYSNQVVSSPTPFYFANGGVPNLGVFGEAGSEAIMPLTRTSGGDLGVKAVGGNQNITVRVVNESGTELEAKSTSADFDMEGLILTIVMDAANTNKMGFRDTMGALR